ncbi:MAG TPA: FHA domain-containing protein [Polyangiaceae bacterium]
MSCENLPMVLQTPTKSITAEIIEGSDAGQRVEAQGEFVTIGTSSDCGIVVHDGSVAPRHVELARRGDGILVVDLGSATGTRVGDVVVLQAVVPSGSVLRVGNTALRLELGQGDEEPISQTNPSHGRSEADGQGTRSSAPSLFDRPYRDARAEVLNEFEGRFLRHLLQKTRGNVSAAARTARMDRSYLIKLLKKHRAGARG